MSLQPASRLCLLHAHEGIGQDQQVSREQSCSTSHWPSAGQSVAKRHSLFAGSGWDLATRSVAPRQP